LFFIYSKELKEFSFSTICSKQNIEIIKLRFKTKSICLDLERKFDLFCRSNLESQEYQSKLNKLELKKSREIIQLSFVFLNATQAQQD